MDSYTDTDSYSKALEGNRWHVIIKDKGSEETIPVTGRQFACAYAKALPPSVSYIVEPCWGGRPCKVCDHPHAIAKDSTQSAHKADVLCGLSNNLSHHLIAAVLQIKPMLELIESDEQLAALWKMREDLHEITDRAGLLQRAYDTSPF
jgi:hypothetical protein